MKTIDQTEISGKNVFLRVDFNVPMEESEITDDNRIEAALPTIKYLIEHGAKKITVGSHLGKPEGENNPKYSLWPVANRLAEKLDIDKKFDGPTDRFEFSDSIVLLENLRFEPGEEADDPVCAEKLAAGQDIYINDAFAVSHRANASVHAITKILPSYGGLLLQKEVEELGKIKENPTPPFVLIIGGVKIEDKAGVIEYLAPKIDKILLGGGVANTFAKANGQDIGGSVYDEGMVEKCKEMIEKYGDKIVMPTDFIADSAVIPATSSVIPAEAGILGGGQDPRVKPEDDKLGGGFKYLDIGPETQKNYAEIIANAKTVFWNGNLGYTEDEKYSGGSRAIAEALNHVDGTTVIAGGDTVGFVKSQGLDKNISFISTGGGAALEFLAGKELPGITALQ